MRNGDDRHPASTGWTWDAFAATLGEELTELLDEPVTGLTPGTHLLDDVGLDSFTVLVLREHLEARFAVQLPPTEVEPTAGHLFELLTALGATSHAAP